MPSEVRRGAGEPAGGTQGRVAHSPNDVRVPVHKPLHNSTSKYSRTPLIRTLVIRIGLALRVNLSIILQN